VGLLWQGWLTVDVERALPVMGKKVYGNRLHFLPSFAVNLRLIKNHEIYKNF
jgi:hypothetical protein